MMISSLLMLWIGSQSGLTQNRNGLLGADEALRRINAYTVKSADADPYGAARTESAALMDRLSTMSPAQAAEAWVKLMQSWEAASDKNPSPNPNMQVPDQWEEIMMTPLPEPAAWPIIRDELAKLPPTTKRKAAIALVDDLLGRDKEVLRYLESKRNPDLSGAKEDVFNPDHAISEAEQPIAERTGDLNLLERVYVRREVGNGFLPWNPRPDLVRIFGKERAASIIKQVLEAVGPMEVNFDGRETQDVARSVVLSDLAKLKSPQWGLIRGLDDFAFVSAQVGRFGEEVLRNTGSSDNADLIYGLGVARRGEFDHDQRFLSSISGGDVDLRTFVKPGSEELALFDLVSKLMDRAPIDSLWSIYVQLGQALGQMKEVDARLSGWLSGRQLTADRLPIWLDRKADLDLANGRIKQAISGYESAIRLKYTDPIQKLLNIASLSGDHSALDFVANAAKGMGTGANSLNLFRAYVDQGRITDAQREILSATANVHNVNLSAEGNGRLLNADVKTGNRLAELYYLDNEPTEILSLLRQYPRWGVDDLSGLIGDSGNYDYTDRGRTHDIGFYAAWALARTGQSARAIRVLHSLMSLNAKDDDASNLLRQLDGSSGNYNDAKPSLAKHTLDEQARSYENTNCYSVAAELYDKAIVADPVDAEAQAGLARSLALLGKPSEARAAIEKALSLIAVGRSPKGRFDLLDGWTRYFPNDEVAIRAQLDSLKRTHPRNSEVLYAIAEFDSTTGDFTGALDSFEEAAVIDPNSVRPWQGIAELWPQHVATYQQTREAVLKLIQLDPLNWSDYQTANAVEAFADKSALWNGYRNVKAQAQAPARVPLFPLDASRRSLASGTRPITVGGVEAHYRGPGSVLGENPEVRSLFP